MESNSKNKIVFWGPSMLLPFVPIFITDNIAIKSCYLSTQRLSIKDCLEIELSKEEAANLGTFLKEILDRKLTRYALTKKNIEKTILPMLANVEENLIITIPTYGKTSVPFSEISIKLNDANKEFNFVSESLILGNLYKFICYSILGGSIKPCGVSFVGESEIEPDVIRLDKPFTFKSNGLSTAIDPCFMCPHAFKKINGICMFKEDGFSCVFKYLPEKANTELEQVVITEEIEESEEEA